MSLLCYPLFLLYELLNMFRATMCPSSGADECVVLSPRVGIVLWLQEGCQNRLAGSVRWTLPANRQMSRVFIIITIINIIIIIILDFKLSPFSECCMLSSGQFPGVWIQRRKHILLLLLLLLYCAVLTAFLQPRHNTNTWRLHYAVVSSWRWAHSCPKHVEQLVKEKWRITQSDI